MSLASSLIRSLRPRQWTKNLLVFAGLIFGEKLRDPHALAESVAAFAVFCALSGVVYLINDVRDRDADRQHPTKSKRPIASGAVTPGTALGAAAVIAIAAATAAWWIGPRFFAIAVSYLTLLTFYSIWLKHVVLLDALAVAGGFVMRAAAGAAAVDVRVSHWLLVVTLLGALFLALSKRRAEIIALADGATAHRPTLAEYSPYLLDQMISVVTASTLLAYAFYTISPETVGKFGTDRLVWTVPFPLYGIFRYLYLVHQRAGGGNPSETLIEDRPIQICIVLWGATILLILYGPWR